ncbi:Hypothetical protein R9X50_00502700 [Acrodontium crateriforme]|uniref:Nuclear matrix protein n=1 Tax=Acrodontium crateriforme TaxID=150365 RepID=A0AAQ3M5A4_9PEZI|nr:Hypothetical protein R9X50_00502700 [Acrodontium crateriforme]
MAATTVAEVESVAIIKAKLQALLELARALKSEESVEPPLPTSKLLPEVDILHDDLSDAYDQNYRFAVVEAAARDIFYSYINDTEINDPSFTAVWNLLDILLLCGDRGQCTPELVCWLIEELLDSQTTSGCRTVFDYLESRRARLAAKDFHKKNLVFLRSCNELLRRLSRAEDAIFCGRVFFFLFQTFPLGDKSSVNLRGEFHTENLTTFETPSTETDKAGDQMEVDAPHGDDTSKEAVPPSSLSKAGAKTTSKNQKKDKKTADEEVLSQSELYPIFWRLQQDFCEPTRLFAPDNFQVFKKSLACTITKFKKTNVVPQSKGAEGEKRGMKRKIGNEAANGEAKDHFADNYNPKYLTSSDLFDLELSDIAFQRHILVQALILIDFLLSLTDKAKQKLASLDVTNKSMLYAFTLGEEDTKWATSTRSTIISYIQSIADGRFYCRMVETVLARDKNWVRWKVESCPSIVRDPVSTEEELAARKGASDATRPKRIPVRPNNAMDFSFFEEGGAGGLAALKKASRYTGPSVEELVVGIDADDLDLEFAEGNEAEGLMNAMSNKKWRALRQTRAKRLSMLEKVEPGRTLKEIFMPPTREMAEMGQNTGESNDEGLEVNEQKDANAEDVATAAATDSEAMVT